MMLNRELSLEDLLNDPVINLIMARDGFFHEDVRYLMRQAAARAAGGRHQSRPVVTSAIKRRCECIVDAA